MLVFTLVFHTYLAYMIRKAKRDETSSEETKEKVEIGHRCIKVQPLSPSRWCLIKIVEINFSFGNLHNLLMITIVIIH